MEDRSVLGSRRPLSVRGLPLAAGFTVAAQALALWVFAHPQRPFGVPLVFNHGVGLGLLSGAAGVVPVVDGVTVVLLAIITLFFPTRVLWPEALALGGALSNFLDRLFHGAVIDYWKIPPWPFTFNLSDVFIRIGIVVWVLILLFGSKVERSSTDVHRRDRLPTPHVPFPDRDHRDHDQGR